MSNPVWIQLLRELLCRLYQAWGGDCADLPWAVPARIQVLVDTYAEQGAPQFANPTLRLAFLALLDEVELHLNDPANDLTGQDAATLGELIANLRNDVDPPPIN